MTTPKQALMGHMMNDHGFSRPAGTHKQLILNHRRVHTSNVYLTHTHKPDGWVTGGEQIQVRISLCPPKNPSASRNGDRNWVLHIAHKDGGYRYEMPGTWEGDVKGAKEAANKLLGYEANWVINATGYGYTHQDHA
jgi:hypothetical protein